MENKILLSLIALIAFSCVLKAQKPKNESLGYYQYVQPPIDTRLTGHKTYRVVGHGDADGHEKDKISKAITLAGYEKYSNSC